MKKLYLKNKIVRAVAVLCMLAITMPLFVMAASTVSITSAAVGGINLSDAVDRVNAFTAGATINVAGTHSTPGAEVTYAVTTLDSDIPVGGMGQVTSDAETGAYTFECPLPYNIAAGVYSVKVSGTGVSVPVYKYFAITDKADDIVILNSVGNLDIGDSVQLYAGAVNNAENKALEWLLYSGSDVVTLSNTGVLSATGVGRAIVVARYVDTPEIYIQKIITVGSTVTPIANASFTLSVTGNGVVDSLGAYTGTIDSIYTASLPLGSSFTFTAQESDGTEFIHWVDKRSNRVLSTELEYTMKLGTDMEVEAVFYNAQSPKFVMFMEKNRTVRTKGDADTNVTVPDNPIFTGYNFVNWKIGEEDTAWQAKETVPANTYTENTILVAYHEQKENKHTINFVNVKDQEASKQYLYNTKIVVEPKEPEAGKKFAYWKKNGHIISYSETYEFYVGEFSATVEAVYVDEAETIIPQPIIVMMDPVMTESSGSVQTWSHYMERSAPDSVEIVESGIILSSSLGETEELTLSNYEAKGTTLNKKTNGQYTVRKKSNVGEIWTVRGYVIYHYGGETIIDYSNSYRQTIENDGGIDWDEI